MTKTLRMMGGKRRSLKRTGRKIVNGKRSKAVRKNGSRRRIRMIRGGAIWLNEHKNNLSYVWNSLFYERAKNYLNDRIIRDSINGQRKALFVIDMQLDFMDRDYDRIDKNEKHPVHFGLKNGNFAVVQAGDSLAKGVAYKIRDVLNENGLVIFSRDYHPKGHSSFNNAVFFESNLCRDCKKGDGKPYRCVDVVKDGVFPAHCVQGKQGTRFITEVQELIDGLDKNKKSQVIIAFKGIHMESDSYTAVDKDVIDAGASNSNHPTCKGCSQVSGGYQLVKKNGTIVDKVDPKQASVYMGTFTKSGDSFTVNKEKGLSALNTTGWSLQKINYDELLKGFDVIEVCGLAGDYCVRDTVVALAQKFKSTKIVLLGDLTAYPSLPFGTINTIPQHVSEDKYSKEGYRAFKGNFDEMYEKAMDMSETGADKDITYYLLKEGENGKELLTKDEIEINIGKYTKELAANLGPNPPTIFHFITPHQEILDDYLPYENIHIQMTNYIEKPPVSTASP